MIESRLERGVLWVGANDGPVSVTRDSGKTWKRVTPPGLVGARIQTIEDSPHQRGRAYIAAYRFTARARPQALHLSHGQLRRVVDAADRWTQRTAG